MTYSTVNDRSIKAYLKVGYGAETKYNTYKVPEINNDVQTPTSGKQVSGEGTQVGYVPSECHVGKNQHLLCLAVTQESELPPPEP